MTQIGYIALGSNLGDRLGYFKQAVASLHQNNIETQAKSSIYISEPMGVETPQPDYFNAVIRISSQLDANALLYVTQRIERQYGRMHKGQYQSRNLDLDIILYGHSKENNALLTIPHPRFLERNFVVIPLNEILTSGWPESFDPLSTYLSQLPPLKRHCEPQAW